MIAKQEMILIPRRHFRFFSTATNRVGTRNYTDCALHGEFMMQLHISDDVQHYQNNWEVRFWLGEQDVAGVNTSLAKDKRIRWPCCLLTNNPLRLPDQDLKVMRPWAQLDPPSGLGRYIGKEGKASGI